VVTLDPEGNLLIGTEVGGTVQQRAPVAYQVIGGRRVAVEAGYVLTGANLVGIVVGAYDSTKPLVIDPVLAYSTYLGSSGYNEAHGIAVDGAGDAYVAGQTTSLSYPTTSGTIKGTDPGASSNAFVTKLNATGTTPLYSTYLGGSAAGAYAIAVDPAGNAYLTGCAGSSDFPIVNAYQSQDPSTYCSAFVSRLNAAGNALTYSTYLGGGTENYGQGIAVDAQGDAYVTGYTNSSVGTGNGVSFPLKNAEQSTYGGGHFNAFVAKINTQASGSASLVYSTFLGGSDQAIGLGIAVDSSGSAYVTGQIQTSSGSSTTFPLTNAMQSSGAHLSGFVSKFSVDGTSLVYSTYIGGSSGNFGTSIAVDPAGEAYIAGDVGSSGFPTTSGAVQGGYSSANSGYNGFVMKLNAAGSAVLYGTYLGGNRDDQANGIAVDGAGNAYVTGQTTSGNFPTANALRATNNGNYDAFVAKINPAASGMPALVYGTYLGGSTADYGEAIAVDGVGNAYVAGYTYSADFPTTVGSYDTAYGSGSDDTFMVRIDPAPTAIVTIDDGAQGGANVSQFNYTGNWIHCATPPSGANCDPSYYNSTNSADNTANDYLTLPFYGTGVTYYATKASNRGIAAVSIDGGAETTVDLYAAAQQGNAPVYVSPPLASGFHTLKIRVTGTANSSANNTYVTVDRADITQALSDLRSSPYRQRITVTNSSGTATLGGSATVPVPATSTDYVAQIHLTGSQAAYVYNNASDRSAFTDVSLWYVGGGASQQLDIDYDTVTNGAWSPTNVTLWFKLQAPIGPNAADGNYVLAWGNPNAAVKRVWANIYPLQDAFAGSVLDSNKWTTFGGPSVSVANGQLTVSNPSGTGGEFGVQSLVTYGTGYQVRMFGSMAPTGAGIGNAQTGPTERLEMRNGTGTPFAELRVRQRINVPILRRIRT